MEVGYSESKGRADGQGDQACALMRRSCKPSIRNAEAKLACGGCATEGKALRYSKH